MKRLVISTSKEWGTQEEMPHGLLIHIHISICICIHTGIYAHIFIYEVPYHSNCPRNSYMTQTESNWFSKIHIDILGERKKHLSPWGCQTTSMSLELLATTFPNSVGEAMSASRKIRLKNRKRAEIWREREGKALRMRLHAKRSRGQQKQRGFGRLESPVPPLMLWFLQINLNSALPSYGETT